MLKAIEVSRLAKQGIEAQQGFTNGVIPSTDVQFLEDGNGFVFILDAQGNIPVYREALRGQTRPKRDANGNYVYMQNPDGSLSDKIEYEPVFAEFTFVKLFTKGKDDKYHPAMKKNAAGEDEIEVRRFYPGAISRVIFKVQVGTIIKDGVELPDADNIIDSRAGRVTASGSFVDLGQSIGDINQTIAKANELCGVPHTDGQETTDEDVKNATQCIVYTAGDQVWTRNTNITTNSPHKAVLRSVGKYDFVAR